MAYTIPSDTVTAGSAGHPTAHNNIADILTGNNAAYNVLNTAYSGGADPTGTNDSTTAIQDAITAANNSSTGNVVYFPAGTYKISAALTVGSAVTLRGEGSWTSTLNQTSTTANAITLEGSGIQNVLIENLNITGPGSGSGVGIYGAAASSATPILQLVIRNVYIETMGSHGIELVTPIVTTLDNVQSYSCGGRGFYLTGAPATPTYFTSVSLISCYANGCTSDGYYLQTLNYCSLTGCASDSNSTGYVVAGGQGVTLNGCGCEVITGHGFTVTDDSSGNLSYGVVLNGCTVRANSSIAFYVAGGSKNITLNGVAELSTTGSPAASIETVSGTESVIINPTIITAASYASTTAYVITYTGGVAH